MTRQGLDPGTVRLVAQRLNHYANLPQTLEEADVSTFGAKPLLSIIIIIYNLLLQLIFIL